MLIYLNKTWQGTEASNNGNDLWICIDIGTNFMKIMYEYAIMKEQSMKAINVLMAERGVKYWNNGNLQVSGAVLIAASGKESVRFTSISSSLVIRGAYWSGAVCKRFTWVTMMLFNTFNNGIIIQNYKISTHATGHWMSDFETDKAHQTWPKLTIINLHSWNWNTLSSRLEWQSLTYTTLNLNS